MAKSSSNSKIVTPLTCPHCAGPLSKEMETSRWTVPPLVRDSFSMIGSAVGGTTSAFYAFNYVMPTVRKWVKGPMWLHFLIGAPPVIVFSSACAGLAGIHCMGSLSVVASLHLEVERDCLGKLAAALFTSMELIEPSSAGLPKLPGGAVPAFAQLASSSYHAAMLPSSHSSQDDKTHKSRTSSTL